ncbi:DnaT-like ssDNA-binding domain-containing protein [Anaerobiospirillum sp. NML120448]|uniref:DnaT-like ssDNA-binding domain-containing protein n=1 Tax=Anaerobiospirillum sp. NML120448 TaxID=2932816 RepID=UPI001FF45A6C|nr:DnaT-like ssDNA-binding domain-containing protein [Anaerobiospirillum sp. NML120448]MCK0514153.1 DnaT-like ssDNA-binding domain-containing protein [Anaerobiospirillum sp. NML120448]
MFDQDNLMLNRAEFAQLQSTLLSHMARTLYIFYIQPIARSGQLIVDPIAMTKQLISISSYAPCNPSLKDVEQALLELEQINLIKRAPGTISWQGAHVILPLFVMETNFVPSRPFQMFPSWQPSASYPTVALQAGLIDYHYQDHELQSFISFWITRTLSRNQQAWERSFVMRLLKVRSAQTVKSYDRKNNDSSFAGYSSSTQPNAYVPNPLAYNQSTPVYTENEAEAETETYDESYSSYDIPSSIFNSDYEQTPPIFPNPFNDGPLSGNASSGNTPYQSAKAQGGFNNFSKSQQNIPERNSAIAKYAYKMSEAKLRDLERREREYNEKRNQIDYSARSEDTKRQVAQMLSLTNHHQQNLDPTANQAPQSSPAQAMAQAQANGQAPAQGQANGMAQAQAPAPAATSAAPTGAKAGATGQVLPANKANSDYGAMKGQAGEQALQMHSEQGLQQSGELSCEQSGEPMMVASERDFGHQDVSSEPDLEYGQDNSVYNSHPESSFDTGGGVDMQELYARYDSVYTKHNDPKSRVNKPTLFALATGKEDFESIAPGYTDPELQEQKRQLATGQEQALYSGYEPLTVAKDYTPSKVNDNISSSLLNEDSSCIVADAGLLTTAEAMEKAFFGSSARTLRPNEQEQGLKSCHEGKPLSESDAYWCGAEENLEPISSEQEQFGRTIEGTVGNTAPQETLETLEQPFNNATEASAELITPMDLSAPMDLTGNMAELSSNSDLTGATWSRDHTEPTNPTEFTEFDKTAGAAAGATAAAAAGIASADGISGASWANGSTAANVYGWANEAMESAGDESWYISEPSVEERATQGFDKSFLAELSSEFKKN